MSWTFPVGDLAEQPQRGAEPREHCELRSLGTPCFILQLISRFLVFGHVEKLTSNTEMFNFRALYTQFLHCPTAIFLASFGCETRCKIYSPCKVDNISPQISNLSKDLGIACADGHGRGGGEKETLLTAFRSASLTR